MDTHVLTNARCYTFNPEKPIAERLLIKDRKIIATGNADEIPLDSYPKSKISDLQGMTVLPAFTDSHIHLLEYGLSLRRVLCETPTRQACLDRVRERVEMTPERKWVLGHGWNHNIWPDGLPDKELLDRFSADHPIYLTHKSLHSSWANSAALKAAGISKNSADPQGGSIGRHENGEPNGLVYEGAMRLVENAIPKPDKSERRAALHSAQTELLRFGISCVHDFDGWDCYETLVEMVKEGLLKLRVVKNIPYPNLEQVIESGIKSGQGSELLSFGWLKLFADGALGPQTASVLTNYLGSDNKGMLLLDSEMIIEIGQKAMSAGISLAVHAIGDRANREVLNGYAQLKQGGYSHIPSLMPRIEHVQLISPEDIPRLSQMGITASMQPIHAVSDRDMADRYWGEACENAYVWNSVLRSGANLIFGSDAPVESPNPFWGIFSAVSRSSIGIEAARTVWTPKQRIKLNETLAAYITQPQLAAKPGLPAGRLQKGYCADLVVLPRDIFNVPEKEIASILPVATMVNGEWVYPSPFGIQ